MNNLHQHILLKQHLTHITLRYSFIDYYDFKKFGVLQSRSVSPTNVGKKENENKLFMV